MNQADGTDLSERFVALEQRVGRILLRPQFGKPWQGMTPAEQAQVFAYCERVVGQPQALKCSALRPNIRLEISQGKVWAVVVECDSELSAYRFGKWAVAMSALVAILSGPEGYRVRCFGLNPRVWGDVLARWAS